MAKDRDPAALFVDYNQNARDHTMAAAYSVRGMPRRRCRPPSPGTRSTSSTPATDDGDRPRRFAEFGDLHAGIDEAPFAIDELLEWAARDERAGAEDPPEPAD